VCPAYLLRTGSTIPSRVFNFAQLCGTLEERAAAEQYRGYAVQTINQILHDGREFLWRLLISQQHTYYLPVTFVYELQFTFSCSESEKCTYVVNNNANTRNVLAN